MLLATGCYDGTIIVQRSDTGHFTMRMNAGTCSLPMHSLIDEKYVSTALDHNHNIMSHKLITQ